MTILTSCTSCQRNQVKSRNNGKTHTFQYQIKSFEVSSHNSHKRKEGKNQIMDKSMKLQTNE